MPARRQKPLGGFVRNQSFRRLAPGAGLALLACLAGGCTTAKIEVRPPPAQSVAAAAVPAAAEPFPSTYRAPETRPTLIRGGTVLTGAGGRLEQTDVLLIRGKVAQLGPALNAPEGAIVVDARGKWVTPGLIDVHSHLGVYPSPAVSAHSDGNEMIDPITAHAWAEHGIWPQDPGFEKALEGGVTSLQILPGSGNLIGGRGVTLKNVPATSYQAMKFPGAPQGVKMATGENPKRVYGGMNRAPKTRMGNVAGYRQAFADAQNYRRDRQKYQRDLAAYERKRVTDAAALPPTEPKRDLRLETLAAVLDGTLRVHIHCYRADEMMTMLDLADEFGFKIAAFHHAVEAYKIADTLARRGVGAAMWADWWGFKMEAYDGIQENIALVDYPEDSLAIVHSDSEEGIQRLNQEAAKVMGRAKRLGLSIPPERAVRWLTLNPAKALGVDGVTGSLEIGKNADVVVWNRNPFSVYALAEKVWIDGAPVFDRSQPSRTPRSDFLLGISTEDAR